MATPEGGKIMTVKTKDLPLDAIAKYCRHWGIDELYQAPTEVKPWTGPFKGTEVFLLMRFRDDVPHKSEHILMGRYLSKLTGRKVFCGWLDALWEHRQNDFIRDEILETMEPVYVEPEALAKADERLAAAISMGQKIRAGFERANHRRPKHHRDWQF